MKHLRTISLLTICLFLADLAVGQTVSNTARSRPSAAATVSAPDGVSSALSGSGTKDYVPLWTSSTALGKSILYQTGGKVGVNTTAPAWTLDVSGNVNTSEAYKIGGDTVLALPGGSEFNVAVGYAALLNNETTAIQNNAIGFQALVNNTTGSHNNAMGLDALYGNTTGTDNTAIGDNALNGNSVGSFNTGTGASAINNNTSGSYNTANGGLALSNNSTGSYNTAVGYEALSSYVGSPITGSNNTATGTQALQNNTSGSGNIAVGYQAAYNVSSGNSNNIHIGSLGQSADDGVIRVGTLGTQTSFYAAGIYGVSSGSSSAIPVLVDSSGQLVTVSSSRRFKEDIQDMGDASSGLMNLRPVTFRYKKPLADGSQPVQYGLIAEEVAEVYPDLVARSADGQIDAVKYQLLDPLLLNEVQRQQAEIRSLQERLDKMEAALAAVTHAPESR
jgi:hypothetical protein